MTTQAPDTLTRQQGRAHVSPIRKEVQIGDCRLLLGDCMEILPTLGKVDAVELDETYFNIACDRIRKAVAQPDLFIARKEPAGVQPSIV